ncbi:hypothetical protein CMI47_01205 [Candidatus Pacearchaeota archaeon]|nr:hypothetical protein [Candidatus Pacearchaeota archaeon]
MNGTWLTLGTVGLAAALSSLKRRGSWAQEVFITDLGRTLELRDEEGNVKDTLGRYGAWMDLGRGKPEVAEISDDLEYLRSKYGVESDVIVIGLPQGSQAQWEATATRHGISPRHQAHIEFHSPTGDEARAYEEAISTAWELPESEWRDMNDYRSPQVDIEIEDLDEHAPTSIRTLKGEKGSPGYGGRPKGFGAPAGRTPYIISAEAAHRLAAELNERDWEEGYAYEVVQDDQGIFVRPIDLSMEEVLRLRATPGPSRKRQQLIPSQKKGGK